MPVLLPGLHGGCLAPGGWAALPLQAEATWSGALCKPTPAGGKAKEMDLDLGLSVPMLRSLGLPLAEGVPRREPTGAALRAPGREAG